MIESDLPDSVGPQDRADQEAACSISSITKGLAGPLVRALGVRGRCSSFIFWFLGRRMARATQGAGCRDDLGSRRSQDASYASLLPPRGVPYSLPCCTQVANPASRGSPGPSAPRRSTPSSRAPRVPGKTVLISDLVAQIRERGERCILYDKMGSYTRAFFDPARDVLMNPLDARAPRWSPFLEARTPQRLRHDGRRPDPPAEGHGGPLLGHGRAAACSRTARASSGSAASTENSEYSSSTCSRPSSPPWPKPWRARWRSPSWIRKTPRPRYRCGPC